jgi:hypothetical protein
MHICMFEQIKQFSDLFVTRTPLLSRTGNGRHGNFIGPGASHVSYNLRRQ